MTIDTIEDETTNLKIHASICAERYKGIEETFQRVDKRMDSLEHKIDDVRRDVQDGNKATRNTLIGGIASIVVALIGVIAAIYAGA